MRPLLRRSYKRAFTFRKKNPWGCELWTNQSIVAGLWLQRAIPRCQIVLSHWKMFEIIVIEITKSYTKCNFWGMCKERFCIKISESNLLISVLEVVEVLHKNTPRRKDAKMQKFKKAPTILKWRYTHKLFAIRCQAVLAYDSDETRIYFWALFWYLFRTVDFFAICLIFHTSRNVVTDENNIPRPFTYSNSLFSVPREYSGLLVTFVEVWEKQ